MNRLLINADDYGLHPLINDAVATCIERGSVNSISVMANSEHVDYPVLRKFQQAGIFVGAHLSWLRSKWLTEDYNIFGWKEFTWRLVSGGKKFQNDLKKEAEAQIRLMIENGIVPDHLDSHQHVHHFPQVWKITHELSKQIGIKRIRCCKSGSGVLSKRGVGGIFLDKMASSHFNRSKHFYTAGLRYTGNYSVERFESELDASKGFNTELIVHPATETTELDKLSPDWKFDWKKEFQSLLDSRLTEIISQNEFYLERRV